MDIVFQPSALLDWCQRIYGPGQRLLLTDYAYPVDFGNVVAGARETKTVQITQNADFVLLGFDAKAAFGSDDLNGAIKISDSATGEQFSSTSIYLRNLMAAVVNGELPYNPLNLPYPRWIGGNSVLSLQYNNTTVNTAVDFVLTLRGFLIRKLA